MPSRFLSVTTKGRDTLHCWSTERSCVFAAPRPNATMRGRKAVALAIRARASLRAALQRWKFSDASCGTAAAAATAQQNAQPSNWIAHSCAALRSGSETSDASVSAATELAYGMPSDACFAIGSPSVLQAASSFCKFWIWIDSRGMRPLPKTFADKARAGEPGSSFAGKG